MEIKIGNKSFKPRKPTDLDDALIAATGCNAAETALQLEGFPSPGRVASALRPFLPEDAPSTVELAQRIAVADDGVILTAVKKLYTADAPAAEPETKGSE